MAADAWPFAQAPDSSGGAAAELFASRFGGTRTACGSPRGGPT